VSLDADNYPRELEAQYATALAFVESLTARFVGGDRSRVVIIPGNHDVDWNAARTAMVAADPPPPNLRSELSRLNSIFRWDWNTRKAWRLVDGVKYEERFAFYRTAAARFYSDISLRFAYAPSRDFNVFELDEGRIIVGAFNSCAVNDCFSEIGHIPTEAISQCHLALLDSAVNCKLKIAVWHHGVVGSPTRPDFMSAATVQYLISKGFRLGLHGHHHESAATPYSLHVGGEQRMAVIGSGSLCAGHWELPQGVNRQYNLIVIDDDYLGASVHVREMTIPGAFTPGRLPSLGGGSSVHVDWTPDFSPATASADAVRANAATQRAETLFHDGQYPEVAALLWPLRAYLPTFGRQLLTEALLRESRHSDIVSLLSHPESVSELTALVTAHSSLQHFSDATIAIETHAERLSLPFPNKRDLLQAVTARQRLGR